MAKRFTDTEKWERPWFRELPNKYKILWCYILDKCDIAGVWYVDLKLASFLIGERYDRQEAEKYLDKQIAINGNRWLIKDFIAFQYGCLSETNKIHGNVMAKLSIFNEKVDGAYMGYISPINGVKEKDKDKDKEKEEYKDKDNIVEIATLTLKTSFLKTKKEIYPMLNIEGEIRKCVDWHRSKNTRTVKTKQWERAISNWLKKSYDERGVSESAPQAKKTIIQEQLPERPVISAEQAAIVRQSVASLTNRLAKEKAV
jgi:hypothetical protein